MNDVLRGSWSHRVVSLLAATALVSACAQEPDAGAEAAVASSLPEQVDPAGPAAAVATPLTDRAWVRADSSDLPGRMRIFLSDGTLLMDSCWETYRLAAWKRMGGDTITWSEDGQEIRAVVLEQTDAALTIRLELLHGPQQERYRPAEVPFVCPDMQR